MTAALIRFATVSDLDFICRGTRLTLAAAQRKIEAQEIILAAYEGVLIGQVRLEYLWGRVPFLALISVLPEHQRRGIGSALLRYLTDFLREQGHDMLYSSSMADEPAPQAWHRRMGFEECGFIAGINEGGVGEVFFRKQLS